MRKSWTRKFYTHLPRYFILCSENNTRLGASAVSTSLRAINRNFQLARGARTTINLRSFKPRTNSAVYTPSIYSDNSTVNRPRNFVARVGHLRSQNKMFKPQGRSFHAGISRGVRDFMFATKFRGLR